MHKKKMSREERAEYKNGKYTGGPAEEKAEMKKKSKRMADGGLPEAKTMTRRTDTDRQDGAKRGERNENAAAGGGRGTGLPPGLAKRGPGNLPPGLARMAQLPAGLRGATTPRPPVTPPAPPPAAPAVASMPPAPVKPAAPVAPAVARYPGPWADMMKKQFGTTMKGGGLARKGVGMALANGGMVRANGKAQRGKTRGKMC